MSEYKEVCTTDSVPEGEMKSFQIEDISILIINHKGTFFAMDAICNHKKGKLEKGHLKDDMIICPVHRCRYDIKTGKVKRGAGFLVESLTGKCNDQPVFPVKVEDKKIFVEL